MFWFRALARELLGACFRRFRGGALLLVLPPDFLAPGLAVLWLSVPVSLLVFLVSSDYGLSFGVLSAGRCFVSYFRLPLFSGRRVHPGGLTELALWRSFSNSSSRTSIF